MSRMILIQAVLLFLFLIDSGTLAYKNANLFVIAIRINFD